MITLLLPLALGACETASKVVDAANPFNWFGDDEKAAPPKQAESPARSQPAQRDFPKLSSVPERPKVPSLEERQQQLQQGLVGDAQNARYSDDAISREVNRRSAAPQIRQPASPRRVPPPRPAPPSAARTSVPPPPPVAQPRLTQPQIAQPQQASRVPPPPIARPQSVQPQVAVRVPPPQAVPAPRAAVPAPVQQAARPAVPPAPPPLRPAVQPPRPAPAIPRQTAAVPPPPAAAGQGFQLSTIYFRDGSTSVQQQDRQILSQVAAAHRRTGGILKVVGHASGRVNTFDPSRRQAVNYQVSLRRAEAVAKELVRQGVPPSSLRVEGMGDSSKVYAEVTATGEAANRRAEIFLIR